MDESLLNQYLGQIQNGVDSETHSMQQFSVIKNLINRKEFNLSDRHVSLIHNKFKDLSLNRKNRIYNEKKQQHESKIYD